jgi:hypothetical protein
VDSFHRRQIDHQTAVDDGVTCHVVPTATDGHFQLERVCQLDRIAYVCHTTAARDDGGMLVDQSIVYAPRVVVFRVGGL